MLLGKGVVLVAQPTLTLVLDPDIRQIEIGGGVKEIGIIAEGERRGLTFAWTLDGPGRLDGDLTVPGILYVLPDSLSEISGQATVTVVTTDEHGQQATYQVIFLLNRPTSTPSPTVAPVPTSTPLSTPSPTPEPSIPPRIRDVLLKDGSGFFISPAQDGKYRLTPEEHAIIEVLVDNPSKLVYTVICESKRGTVDTTTYVAPHDAGVTDTLTVKLLTTALMDMHIIEIKTIEKQPK